MKTAYQLLFVLVIFNYYQAFAQNAVSVGSGSYADSPPEGVWDEGAYYGKTYRELSEGWPWYIHAHKQSDPVPTNDWWTAVIFEQYTGNLEAYPHRVEGTSEGIEISVPESYAMFDARGLSVNMGTTLVIKGQVDPELTADTEIYTDFESETYPEGWTVTDDPPYSGPVSLADFTQSPTPSGFLGDRFINTYAGDGPQVTLTSPSFVIDKNYIHFLVGGGNDIDLNYVGLYIDGVRIDAATGENSATLDWARFDVAAYVGQTAEIRIVDVSSGGWGFTLCDNIVFSNDTDVNSSFSSSFWPQDAKAYDWSDLGLVFRLEDDQSHYMDASVYHGIPYTFIDLHEVAPIISAETEPTAYYSTDGEAIASFPYSGNTVVVETEGKLFGIHAPTGTSFELSAAGNIVPVLPEGSSSYLVISVIPALDLISTYEAYARNKVTGSTFDWAYDESAGKIETDFQFDVTHYESGVTGGETLLALLPHQYRNTTGYSLLGGADYETMNGVMHTAIGNSVDITYDFDGMPPYLPKPLNLDSSQSERLSGLISTIVDGSATYNGNTYAKGFGEESNIMLMAKETGHSGYATIKENIRNELEDWLTYESSESSDGSYFFAEYPQFGAMIGFPVGYGSQAFNDLHFHYGYFITGAARLMMVDEDFKDQYADMVKRVAKSYANWKRYGENDTDKLPFLRNFDPYAGHSWAGGVGSGTDGNNQESTSEAMHAWFGIYLLGVALEDDEILSLGATGFMLEGLATQTYWFNRYDDMPEEYIFDYVGILKANNMAMATFFDGDPAWAFGIQAVPCDFYYSYYLGKEEEKAASDWESMLADRVSFGEYSSTDPYENIVEMGGYLGGYHLNYLQSYDPQYVATTLDQILDMETEGWSTQVNTPTNYYIANAGVTYGRPAEGYRTSIATGGVYVNEEGEYTTLIYNYTNETRNIDVYYNDVVVETVAVGAKQYYNSRLVDGQSPVVNAGSDQEIFLPQSEVELTGTASDDGSVASYLWTLVSGADVTIATPDSISTQVSGLATGIYVFRLTVTDNDQNTAYDEVTVHVYDEIADCEIIALQEAWASSEETVFIASNAIDGNWDTRWGSEFSVPQWLMVDMGSSYNLSEMILKWERASAESYYVMVSDENSTPDPTSEDWTTIASLTGMVDSERVDTLIDLSGCGRYFAIYAINKLHDYGISLYEVQACGNACEGTSSASVLRTSEHADEADATNATLYPNPVCDQLSISMPSLKAGDVLTVYSLDGQVVLTKQAEAAAYAELDVQNLQPGLYIIQISGKNQFKFQKQ